MASQDGTGNEDGKGRRAHAAMRRHRRGFAQAARFLDGGVSRAAARRGLTETRIVTQWTEIVGALAGAVTMPVGISRRGRSLGGTLELRAAPGRGPEVEMMAPQIVERVNACFGYRAVARIRLVQDGPSGFAEPAAAFDPAGAPEGLGGNAPGADRPGEPPPETRRHVADTVAGIDDPDLRHALERLGLAIAQSKANRV
ncbi:MAG: DciA family protein [Pseudomonadota bacterium]